MDDDLVTWLRRQIRLRLTLATIVPVVDYQGDEPAPPAPAYRQYVDGVPWYDFTRDSLVRHLVTSGVLVTGEPPETWLGAWRMDDLTPLMAPGDPQETLARCKAELAILDQHPSNDFEKYPECAHCAVEHFPCRTVRLLGSGYKHRAGYREEWKA
jgi:hypothetical protein